MGDITILIDYKGNISLEWLECLCLSIIGQSSVNIKVLFCIKKDLLPEELQKLEYLKNFIELRIIKTSLSKCIKMIDTEYTNIIGANDILYPHFSYTLAEYLSKNKEIDIVYGTSFRALADERGVVQSKRRYKGERFSMKKVLVKDFIYLGSCMFRTSALTNPLIFLLPNRVKFILLALNTKIFYLERDLSEVWELKSD